MGTAGWGRARWYQPPLPGSRPGRSQAPRPQDLPSRGEWGSGAAAGGGMERDGYKTSAPFEHCGLETSGLSISLPPPPPPSSSRSNEQTHHQPHTLSRKASAARYRPNVSHPHTTTGLSRLEYLLFRTLASCLWRNPDISFGDKEVEAQGCRGICIKHDFCSPSVPMAALETELLTRIGKGVQASGNTQSACLSRFFHRHWALRAHVSSQPSLGPWRSLEVGRFGASEINLPISVLSILMSWGGGGERRVRSSASKETTRSGF